MATTTIDKNQYDYLNNLVAAGGGNGEWAKAQLAESSYVPAPTPPPAYTAPSPNYSTPSTPSYSVPAPAYTGAANVIGSVSNSQNVNQSYQNIADSVRASNPGRNQVNTWTDNKGTVYDTTPMTPQQIHALSLNKNGNKDAAAILAGMGLDINGNPTSSVPAPRLSPTPNSPSTPTSGKVDPLNELLYSKQLYEKQGASDGEKAWASNNAKQYYSQLGGDEATKVQNMNAEQLKAYLGARQPVVMGPPPPPSGSSSSNTSANGFSVMTPDQIKAEAQNRINKLVADRIRVSNQAKQGLQTSYDRQQTNLRQDRTMQDVRDQRSLNPFSGRSDYAQGIKAMERERTDRENQQDLQSKLGNIDVSLADFLNQTPEQQQQIINELTRTERDYAIQREELDWRKDPNNPSNQGQILTNELTRLKIGNFPEEVKQAAALFEQQIKSGELTIQQAEHKLKELQDPNSPTNQAAKLELEIKKMEAAYLPQEQKLRLQQLQKQIAEIGKVPYRSAEDAEYDKVKLERAKVELSQLKDSGGKTTQDRTKKMMSEKQGLISALRANEVTPEEARKTIQDDLRFGFYTQEEASELIQLLNEYSKPPSTKEMISSRLDLFGR